ncbi:MAG: hypothetical protein HYV63_28370 [Candidatus Schekmanbacteria bacterium]|nr:hypothetical protein [Candidatus Schekmanbacteria bacterium]
MKNGLTIVICAAALATGSVTPWNAWAGDSERTVGSATFLYPPELVGGSDVRLTWTPSSAEDFAFFAVWRGRGSIVTATDWAGIAAVLAVFVALPVPLRHRRRPAGRAFRHGAAGLAAVLLCVHPAARAIPPPRAALPPDPGSGEWVAQIGSPGTAQHLDADVPPGLYYYTVFVVSTSGSYTLSNEQIFTDLYPTPTPTRTPSPTRTPTVTRTPTPTPTATPAPPDLHQVIWLHADVSDWAETAHLGQLSISTTQITLDYDKANVWPQVKIGGEPVNANPWVLVKLGEQWYGGTWEWLRPGQTQKNSRMVCGDAIKVGELSDWGPKKDEFLCFMVSGLARDSNRNVLERSNLVCMQWPVYFAGCWYSLLPKAAGADDENGRKGP